MKVAITIHDVRQQVARAKADDKTVAIVPTMGALHAGHRSLIEAARQDCDFVVVSIFVNPTQFGQGEDIDAYPRPLQADLDVCEQCGADLVFTPDVETMYPDGAVTTVSVAALGDTLCGRSRAGHFDGVCTVVAKLFNIVCADKAYFGAKDFQQSTIIRQMVRDLNIPVEIVLCPTIREPDGLAVSSRNVYLSSEQRQQAPQLHRCLQMAADMIRKSHPQSEQVIQAMREYLAQQADLGQVDYIQVVNPADLRDVDSTEGEVVLALAVKFGPARLIDNMLVEDDAPAG